MTLSPQPADAELARRVARGPDGDPEAEALLAARFAPRVRLYGLRHLKSADGADDLVQRVMLLAIEKLRAGAVHEPDRIGSFLLGTARTVAREMRRTRRTEPLTETHAELAHAAAQLEPLGLAQLSRCMDELPERERVVLVLSFYQEQDSAAIGAALGMQHGHVRVARHRALARLRDCMGLDQESPA